MPYNYVDSFRTELEQKYSRELTSAGLTTQNATFIGAKTIKIPRLDVGGYKDHNRAGGWNRQAISNDFELKVLTFDRDVEFYVDAMDVDETNQILSAANTTNVFEEEQAIPELDKYRYSKLYSDYVALGKKPDTTALTIDNVLRVFDKLMKNMDEAEVPLEGRKLYVTPTVQELLKQANDIRKVTIVSNNNGAVNRAVRSLDDVQMVMVPSSRMKTVYDFSDGAVVGVGAKQINMILVHPKAVIAPIKHSAIYLWEPGSHTGGDGYLYQNRRYTDLFLIERKADGIQISVEGNAGGGE
ncbi:capsid protein [Paenibacillus apiarius]|uniref:capsid protein n=1 Tax=Paenibacillus apiarius TaxID=46240 RepID=UPI003B3BBFC2